MAGSDRGSKPARTRGGGLTRRSTVLGGGALLAVGGCAPALLTRGRREPDFGPAVTVLDPAAPRAEAQARIDAIFASQERAHFTDRRFAMLLKPGRHQLDLPVGFFTQVAGLGASPEDVVVDGHVHVEADWNGGIALVNFWRGVENLWVRPPDGQDRWAVSQAAPYRRMRLSGDLALDDGGWSSGGFLADSWVEGTVRSGSQQQWFTRSSELGGWEGANWNMVFAGVKGAPPTRFPQPPYTTLATAPVAREKPFLRCSPQGEWSLVRPDLRRDATGSGWRRGGSAGSERPLERVFIARPGDPVTALNAALADGCDLLLTPGIYPIREPLRVGRAGAIVLGLGFATLLAEGGATAIEVADVPGVTLAGLMIDAGPDRSDVLVRVGPRGSSADYGADPTLLCDLYVRVGGDRIGRAGTAVEINSHGTLADHLWLWRADHGDRAAGREHVGWGESTGEQGLVVNGDDVTCTGLFVEHFQRYQTLWKGERGRTVFYQCELPYDPPSQAAYMAGATRGWAAYKVADHVRAHHATGLGVYANFTADPSIVLESAVEVPRMAGVVVDSVTTISLGGGKGTIAHLVNNAGAAAKPGAVRQTLTRYPAL